MKNQNFTYGIECAIVGREECYGWDELSDCRFWVLSKHSCAPARGFVSANKTCQARSSSCRRFLSRHASATLEDNRFHTSKHKPNANLADVPTTTEYDGCDRISVFAPSVLRSTVGCLSAMVPPSCFSIASALSVRSRL